MSPQGLGSTTTTTTPVVPEETGGWTFALVARMVLLILAAEVGFLVFAYPLNAVVQIGEAFNTNQVAWIQTAFSLSSAVSAMIIGSLADRFGKRRVLVIAFAIGAVGLIISAAAPNFGVLVLGRILQSIALAIPAALPRA